jgi:hypothetical protein
MALLGSKDVSRERFQVGSKYSSGIARACGSYPDF